MVFSSVPPVYLDPPNWHHHHQVVQHEEADVDVEAAARGKANSMLERGRAAKIPQPETALKCPRCESTNTKFCYFNNYNLSQPRHFCKTCRRYWTRGGALRNVPVGGGCRRNKKIAKKTSSSKSHITTPLQNPLLSADQMQNFPPININMFTFQNELGTAVGNGEATRPRVITDAAKLEESQLGLSSAAAATSFLGHYYSNSWCAGNGINMWNGGGDQLQLPAHQHQLNSSASAAHATTHYL